MKIKQYKAAFLSVAFVFLIAFGSPSVAQDVEFAYPDLTVSSAEIMFSENDEYLILIIEITNSGNVNSDSFLVSAGNLDEGWEESQIVVTGLNPGEYKEIEIDLEIPDEQRGKALAFRVKVDPDNEIDELNEENNIVWTSVNVIPFTESTSEFIPTEEASYTVTVINSTEYNNNSAPLPTEESDMEPTEGSVPTELENALPLYINKIFFVFMAMLIVIFLGKFFIKR